MILLHVIRFDDFGGSDDFTTETFLARLWLSGVIDNRAGARNKPKRAPQRTMLDGIDGLL